MNSHKLIQILRKYRLQILCVITGFALFAVCSILMPDENEKVTSLERKGYGQNTSDEVIVSGLADEDITISIPVSGRRYSDEEIEDAFDSCIEELMGIIPGNNESLHEVRENLVLPAKLEQYGFRILWTSENPDVISSSGEVKNDNLSEETGDSRNAVLNALLSDGEREASYSIPVTVLPPDCTPEEDTVRRFLGYVEEKNSASITEDRIVLPEIFEGKEISYRRPGKNNYHFIWIIGIAAAVLLYVRERESIREKQDRKQKQMQLDYPEIVSKLLVFIESGMNLRMAWDHISTDYEIWERDDSKEENTRYAYEEMCKANTRLKTGAPEGQVYRDFGRSCRIKQYMKLAGLLEQNRRSGVANLKSILQLEVVESWEERKNIARRSGEEAGTRLLLPLLMMLGIVMVIIMVPAMMSF